MKEQIPCLGQDIKLLAFSAWACLFHFKTYRNCFLGGQRSFWSI